MPDWPLPLIFAPFIGGFASVLIRQLPRSENAAVLCSRWESFGRRRRRERDGLVHGNAKLMAVVGARFGLAPLADVVLAAALVGLTIAAGLHIAGHALHRGSANPLAPTLRAAVRAAQLYLDASLLPDLPR